MNQTYSKKFHCTYLLHYYPFDTQVGRCIKIRCIMSLTNLKSGKGSCFSYVWSGVPGGPTAAEVCPGQRGAAPWQHGAADRHRADPVLHPDMESGLQ